MARRADPWFVVASDRLYRLLLVVYPSPFRNQYGYHLAQVFRDTCRATYLARGWLGVVLLWIPTLGDLASTGIEERVAEAISSSASHLVRWSGVLSIVSGPTWVAGIRGLLVGDLVVGLVSGRAMCALTALLWLIGSLGLYLRLSRRLGQLGRPGLLLALTGPLIVALGSTLEEPSDHPYDWLAFGLGLLVTSIGLGIVGASAMPREALPRWCTLPILLQSVSTVAIVLYFWALSSHAYLGPRLPSEASFAVASGWFGASWMLLGVALCSGW